MLGNVAITFYNGKSHPSPHLMTLDPTVRADERRDQSPFVAARKKKKHEKPLLGVRARREEEEEERKTIVRKTRQTARSEIAYKLDQWAVKISCRERKVRLGWAGTRRVQLHLKSSDL